MTMKAQEIPALERRNPTWPKKTIELADCAGLQCVPHERTKGPLIVDGSPRVEATPPAVPTERGSEISGN